MKKTFILTLFMMFCSLVYGQTAAPWGEFDDAAYEDYMPVTSSVTLDAQSVGDGFVIGAFRIKEGSEPELRGSARITYEQITGKHLAFINVWGINGEKFTFKLYDSNNEKVYDITNIVLSYKKEGYGKTTSPFNIDFLSSAVAAIGDKKYASVEAAVTAAEDGDEIELLWKEGDAPIAMNASLYGKNVTITGTAKVDWSKGFLFVGRGGEGDATLTFDDANLTSASNNASTGIHVSGREKNTTNKYNGTVVINNSTIELDYLINKGAMTMDNSTLTVKNGFSIGGRPASETESGEDATATIALNNGSKLVVNNHNGMGLGYEAIGVMNVDKTSSFETTQSFLVTAKGTMNIAGTAKIVGTLTNNGNITLTDVDATLVAQAGLNVTTDVEGYAVKHVDGVYKLVANIVENTSTSKTYPSLVSALAAAQAGQTLTFLADITEDVTVTKKVTIDGADKTYTGKMTLKADATIKNVNFDGKGFNGYAIETRGAQYLTIEDCTAKNYGYGFVQLASATALTTVKNVTASNMNYGVKVDYSNAVVLENVDITAGEAALLNSNYGEKTITIKSSELNILGTWTRNNTTKTTYVFEGANSIDEFITDAAIDNFKLFDVNSTLTAPNEVTVTTDVAGYNVVYENGMYKLTKRLPSGEVDYRADVTDNENREGIAVTMKNVYAEESLVVKVYHNDILMFTSTRRERDLDDEQKELFPVDGRTTANIVLWGKESGSWNNEIHVIPTDFNVPNKIEVLSDDELVDTYTHESGTVLGTNLDKYLALECVKKAVAQVGETKYVSLEDAINACTNGETVTIIRDITYTEADVKNAIGGATGFGEYPNPCIISIGGKKGENGAPNIPSSVNAVIDLNGHTITNTAYSYFFMIMDNAKVVFTDSSVDNSGKVITKADGPAVWVIGTETLVTVKDGYFQTDSEGGVMHSTHGGDLVIEGGEFATTAANKSLLIMLNSKDRQNSKFFISGVATVTIKGGIFHGFNPSLVGDDNGATSIEDIKFVDGCADGYAPIQIGENTYGVEEAEAKIGNIGYKTLEEAVAVVKEGETIKLIADVTIESTINVTFDLTIDGNDKTLTYTGTDRAFQITGGTVVINDMTVDMPNVDEGDRGINLYNGATNKAIDVTLNNVEVKGGKAYAVNIGGGKENKLTINNSTLTGYAAINVHKDSKNHTIVVDGSTLNGKNHNDGYHFGAVVVDGINEHNLTITNSTVTTENLDGVTSKYYDVIVSAKTTYSVNEGIEVVVRNVYNTRDGLYYIGLPSAVNKAQAGDELKLLCNTTGAGVVINKNITIDFDGFTYTFNEGVGSTGTESNGFQILKGNNVTLTNGTLNVAESAADKFYILVQNYANLNVVDMTLDGTNLDKWSKVENNWDSYVLSNNSGNVNIEGTTIKANNDGDKAFAFDVCDKTPSYTAPVVNVKSGTIEGNIEVSSTIANNLNISGGLFTAPIQEAWCAEGYIPTTTTVDGVTYNTVKVGAYVVRNTTTGQGYETFQAAIDACTAGDNTIVLLANISDDVTVNETAGVNIKIEGDRKEYSGTINIVGNSTYGDETLSISNVKFVTSEKNHDFIWSDSQNAPGRYCNNVSVDKCYFVATGEAKNTAVGLRIRQGKNIDVTRSVFEGMHSAMQMNGTLDIYVVGLEIKDCKNGISASGQNTLVVEDSKIAVDGYGVRADGTDNSSMILKGNPTISADFPVVVRKTTGAYNLTVESGSYTASNEKGAAVTFTEGDDGTFVAPTANATATIKVDVATFGFEARIGNVYYTTLGNALNAEGNENVTLLRPYTVAASETVVLDLKGKTVVYSSDIMGEAMITNNGTLTVKNGTIAYTYTGVADDAYTKGNYTINNYGTLTVEGNVENKTAKMSHASYAINTNAGATLNVESGNVLNLNGHAIRMVSFGTAANNVNINGGYIVGTRALQVQLPSGSTSTAKPEMNLVIKGGELKSNEETYNLAVYVYSNGQSAEKLNIDIIDGTFNGNVAINAAATATMNEGSVEVIGGTFNGQWGVFSYAEDTNNTIAIKGGAFKTNYSEKYSENDGYIFEFNGTYYIVNPGTYVVRNTTTGQGYTTLRAAVEAASTESNYLWGETIKLLCDITLTGGYQDTQEGLRIEKSVTIDGNGFKIDCGEFTKGIRVYNDKNSIAGVLIKNVTIVNDNPKGSCINTRTANINLNIQNIRLFARGTNSQPLTIGGDKPAYRVDMSSAIIDAGESGYGVICFVPVQVNIVSSSNTQISGMAAFYIKSDASNTEINLGHGTYVGKNMHTETSGVFGTVVIEGTGNTVKMSMDSSIVKAVAGDGSDDAAQAAFLIRGKNNQIIIEKDGAQVLTEGENAYWAMIKNEVADFTHIIDNGTRLYPVAQTGEYQFMTLEEAVRYAKAESTVTVVKEHVTTTTAVVEKDMTIDFAGYAITGDIYPVVRIQNNANVTVKNGNITNGDYIFTLGSSDQTTAGNLTIEGGTYVGETTVASVTKGLLTINGGEFSISDVDTYDYAYLINCVDDNYEDGSAKVAIKGGKFYGFNPEDNEAEQGGHTNFCAAGYGAVETGSDIWTVVPKQSQTLKNGWNWFSSYVNISGEEGLATLENALGQNGVMIKRNGGYVEFYNSDNDAYDMWIGTNFDAVSVKEMYMIKTIASTDIQLRGNAVDYANTKITINNRYNWIGYPVSEAVNVNAALANIKNPQAGDQIKGRDGYAEYIVAENGNKGWSGSLNNLEPGKGYIYYRASDESFEFTYNVPATREEVKANITADNNYWVPSSDEFANNMTITAVLNVNGVEMTDNYEVAAFAGDEVRGSARPIYVESIDRYVMFMTVYGEGDEELTFKYIDLDTYEVHNLNDMVVYADNAIVGSLSKPMVLCYGTLGVDENGFDTMSLYPNPTTTGRAINLEAVCDMVEVFNSLGVKVAEYRNVETIDGIETAGMYVIRVTNGETVKNCRLIVK